MAKSKSIFIEGMEFETTRVRVGVFTYRVRLPGEEWVQGSDFMHGRPSDRKTREALAFYGRKDLENWLDSQVRERWKT